MCTEEPYNMAEVLERARANIAAGELPEWHDDEDIKLHAPANCHRWPLVIDPEAEAILRQHLEQGGQA